MSRPEPTPRAVFEDASLPHQIVLRLAQRSHGLAVSCNCMNGAAIEIRTRWTTAEVIAAWQAHLGSGGEAW